MATVPKQDPDDRKIVDRLIRVGLVISGTLLPLGIYLMPVSDERLGTAWQRIVFTLRWQTLSMLTLIFGYHRVAHLRYTTAAINPLSGKGEKIVEKDSRYLQNTLEQLVISSCGQLVLATYLENSVQSVIPVLVLYFVLARTLFYYGYTKSATKRALGMCMTFAPNLVIYPFNIYCLIVYGPMYGVK